MSNTCYCAKVITYVTNTIINLRDCFVIKVYTLYLLVVINERSHLEEQSFVLIINTLER